MSSLFEDKKTNMAYVLYKLGMWPYPEIIEEFIAVFDNTASKEQIEQVEKRIKVLGKYRVAKAYDRWQEDFHSSGAVL